VEVITHCHEQRVSGLAQAVLIGLTLCALTVLGYIPIAALDGLFIYMGIASFGGNSFYQRLVLFITDPARRAARGLDFLDGVPSGVVRRYTALQLLILACIFGVTLVPYANCLFPVLIAVLVPLRIVTLPKLFGRENVDALDADGNAPDLARHSADADGAAEGTVGGAAAGTICAEDGEAGPGAATEVV